MASLGTGNLGSTHSVAGEQAKTSRDRPGSEMAGHIRPGRYEDSTLDDRLSSEAADAASKWEARGRGSREPSSFAVDRKSSPGQTGLTSMGTSTVARRSCRQSMSCIFRRRPPNPTRTVTAEAAYKDHRGAKTQFRIWQGRARRFRQTHRDIIRVDAQMKVVRQELGCAATTQACRAVSRKLGKCRPPHRLGRSRLSTMDVECICVVIYFVKRRLAEQRCDVRSR